MQVLCCVMCRISWGIRWGGVLGVGGEPCGCGGGGYCGGGEEGW